MSSESDRFPTGVVRLDTILGGDVFERGISIVQGAPGAAKTILGNQILGNQMCFAQAAQGRRALFITLLEGILRDISRQGAPPPPSADLTLTGA